MKTKGKDLKFKAEHSISTNEVFDKFQSGKGIVKDKSLYDLNQSDYDKVACEFYTRSFLLDGELTSWLIMSFHLFPLAIPIIAPKQTKEFFHFFHYLLVQNNKGYMCVLEELVVLFFRLKL